MQHKLYKNQGNMSGSIAELAVDCGTIDAQKSSSNSWNPNVPFIGTQEEWWEHFHQIEQGKFITWEEHKKKFNAWKKEYLTSRM